MRGLLPLIALAASLYSSAPASGQYVYLDGDGDGVCNSDFEPLGPGATSVDVYFDTSHHANGDAAICVQDPSAEFTINSYEFILHVSGAGTAAFGDWHDLMGFDLDLGTEHNQTDIHVGKAESEEGVILEPGLYRVGTLDIAVTGQPYLVVATSTLLNGSYLTAFGSKCPGESNDNTIKLGLDFTDTCWAGPIPDDVTLTTWGKIKQRYR